MAPCSVKNGTICVKSGTLQREKWHPYVKNGTIYVKNGTPGLPRPNCVKNGTRRACRWHLREKWHRGCGCCVN
ncbi:hypothetical protein ACW9KT_18860 [Hymenobacter sp. HD11105]